MSRTIECYEPRAFPPRAALELEPGQDLAVYLMHDSLAEGPRGLRATVLRRADEAIPLDAQLLLEATPMWDRNSFRIRKVNRRVAVDQIRRNARSRLVANTELRSGSRLEVSMPDVRAIGFALEFAAADDKKVAATMGGRGTAKALESATTHLWMIPAAQALIANPKARLVASLQKAAKKVGISPMILMLFMIALVPIVVSLLVALWQRQAAAEAEEQAAKAEEQLAVAEAGLEAALQAEAACMAERSEVVDALNDIEARRALQAEQALEIPLAMTVSIELGGARMGTEETLALDNEYMTTVKELLVNEMTRTRSISADAARCLSFSSALGQDVPRYVLLWHPDPELVCPLGYSAVTDGVHRMGSWGLSRRVADAFGSGRGVEVDDPFADPRVNDRWSSHILTIGYRAVLEALLSVETESRPPVAPGQAHLWALAIWDAYNGMPTPADGVMDQTAAECVDDLLLGLAKDAKPSVPGQPVLPDIGQVVLGDEAPVANPTAGCPWPPEALSNGARKAMSAVTRSAVLLGQEGGES